MFGLSGANTGSRRRQPEIDGHVWAQRRAPGANCERPAKIWLWMWMWIWIWIITTVVGACFELRSSATRWLRIPPVAGGPTQPAYLIRFAHFSTRDALKNNQNSAQSLWPQQTAKSRPRRQICGFERTLKLLLLAKQSPASSSSSRRSSSRSVGSARLESKREIKITSQPADALRECRYDARVSFMVFKSICRLSRLAGGALYLAARYRRVAALT